MKRSETDILCLLLKEDYRRYINFLQNQTKIAQKMRVEHILIILQYFLAGLPSYANMQDM